MNNWEHLRLTRERLRLFFWAARQTILLLVLVVVAISMVVEVALNGSALMLDRFISLIYR
jgi:hypothetical protein